MVVVTRPVATSYTWPETLTFGESKGEVSRRSTSAMTVVRVGDRGGLQCCLGEAGRLGRLVPEAGVGEKPGPALRVVDNSDLEESVRPRLAAEQLLGQVSR